MGKVQHLIHVKDVKPQRITECCILKKIEPVLPAATPLLHPTFLMYSRHVFSSLPLNCLQGEYKKNAS